MCHHRIAARVSGMYLFPSPLFRECSFGREDTFREDYLLWFLFPRQVVPVCICLTWAFPFQDYWLVTNSMGQMLYRDKRVLLLACLEGFFVGKYGGKKAQRLPRKVVESPTLKMFKTHLDACLCNLLQVTLPGQGSWTKWSPQGPSNPNDSVTLISLEIKNWRWEGQREKRALIAQGSKEEHGSALFHALILSGSCALKVLLYLCQWYV